MLFPRLRSVHSLACCALLLPLPAPQAQSAASPAAAFRKTRALYYTPVDKGLRGFGCDVGFDWKQFIEKANSAPVQDTDERLAYLRSIKLTISDDLSSGGQLQWAAPTTAPDASEQSIDGIRSGMQAMWSGFFQSWNGFLTGDLLSLADNQTTVERTGGGGFHVFTTQRNKVAEEFFDRNLLLLSLHVSTPTLDSNLTPIFIDSAQGRLVTDLNSVVKQPPGAAGTNVDMKLQFAAVNGFQLPSALRINVGGTTAFDFTLSNCTVNTKLGGASAR